MNDLQLTLLVVGGGGITAMIGYNWWQDYRLRKQARERFGPSDQDPLLQGTQTGPLNRASSSRTEPGFMREEMQLNPDLPGEEEANNLLDDEVLGNEPHVALDRRLFAEFLIRFDEGKDANTWKSLMDGFDQINRKKIIYCVSPERVDGGETLWFKAYPYAGLAQTLRVHVQLANRKGPLSSIEFSEVLAKLRRFADDQNGELDFPEMKETVAKAETLDQAAAALDTLLGLHCLLPDTVPQSVAVDVLVQAGWSQKGHQWLLAEPEGALLASMVIHNSPGKRLLSFNIDVPNSHDPVKALGDIVTVCHGMNEQFSAPLMDDSGRTLSTQAIEGIYNQLMERVRHLTDSGFKPGSSIAKTLFS
jgi:hypothetical protein